MNLTQAQLTRAIYSLWDFQQALSALTFLNYECDYGKKYGKEDLRRFRCYETTLIVSMARPFEVSRGRVSLGLRGLGIDLGTNEQGLLDRIMQLRRKIYAHSDEDRMHFRGDVHMVLDSIKVPHFQFDEGLHLCAEELHQIRELLNRLTWEIHNFTFDVAQKNPDLLTFYNNPKKSTNDV